MKGEQHLTVDHHPISALSLHALLVQDDATTDPTHAEMAAHHSVVEIECYFQLISHCMERQAV